MSFVIPNSTAAGSNSSSGSAAASSSSATGLNQLDNSQTFLNLLVAQLKNQDPSNPANPTSFMTEIAQLTAVQSQTSLNAEEQTVAADSMLGQKISGTGSGGRVVSGTVTAVLLSGSGSPQLSLAGQSGTVSLDQVTQVYSASAAAAASTPAASSSTSTTNAQTSNPATPSASNSTPTTTAASNSASPPASNAA